MEEIHLQEKEVIEYIEEMVNNVIAKKDTPIIHRFHHNSKYEHVTSILKRGIISINKLNKEGYIKLTEQQLFLLSDFSSHINGIDEISLSVIDDKKIDSKKILYDPSSPTEVDILISHEVKARRASTNYDNEYISSSSIKTENLTAIDIRILKWLNTINYESKKTDIKSLIENYNKLRDIATVLKEENRTIPLREMSKENPHHFDLEKTSQLSKIIIK